MPHPSLIRKRRRTSFQDALAVLTLEAWAEKDKTKVLVVAKDGDWRAYCADSKRLVALDSLATALGCFQQGAANYSCRQISEQLRDGDPAAIHAEVAKGIQDQSWKIEVIPEADSQFSCNEDDTEVVFKSFAIHGLRDATALDLVDYGDDHLVARMMVDVEIEVRATFSFSHWDGIDREYLSMGSGSAVTTAEITVEVLVTFSGVPRQTEIDNVELLPTRKHVLFGEVEPDWMHEGDGYEE